MDNSEAATYPICDSVCGFLSAHFNSTRAIFFLRGGRKMRHSYTFGDVSIYGWFRGEYDVSFFSAAQFMVF